MTSGIYEFGPRQSEMAYGGNSRNIEQRWEKHRWMLRNNKHHCIHLQRAWNKYGEGVFGFVILEAIEDADQRLAAEQAWLDEHWPNCYNTARDASAPMLGRRHTEETCRRISKSLVGNQYALGSQSTKGYKHTDASRQKMSAAQTGELHPMWGKHPSAETRLKQSRARKLWWMRKKAREKNKLRLRGATSIWIKKHVTTLSNRRYLR